MGITDDLRSAFTRLWNPKAPDSPTDVNVDSGPCVGVVGTVTKIGDSIMVNGSKKLEEYVPDPDRREKIGRIITNLGKFAVASAVNESVRGIAGGVEVYRIVKEGLKDQAMANPLDGNKKQDHTSVMMEEMLAKMEKMQEEMKNMKQQQNHKVSIQCSNPTNPVKEEDLSDDPINGSSPAKAEAKKKIFIRSRL